MSSSMLWWVIVLLCLIGGISGYRLGHGSVDEPGPEETVEQKRAVKPRKKELAPPVKRVSVPELAKEFVAALESRDEKKWRGMEGKLKRLSWEELIAMWGELRKLPPGEKRFYVSLPVFRLMADQDPERALALVEESPKDSRLSQMISSALGTWASRDPHAALQKALALGAKGGPWQRQYLSTVFREWSQADFSGALRKAIELKEWEQQEIAVQGLASAVGRAENDPAELLENYVALQSERAQKVFLERGIHSWVQRSKREEVEEWIDEQEFESERASELMRALARGASYRDPQRTAEWLLGRSTPESRAEDLVAAVDRWAERKPEACGRWLNDWVEREGAGADLAIAEYSRTIAGRETAHALQWASRIQDAEVLATAHKWIVRRMGPISDNKVREHLEKAGVDEEAIVELVAQRPRR